MKLAIISALARNRVIGKQGKLPWHIPEDLRRFKALTTGHPVLMGRKTFEALGKPLANRRNVVLSSAQIPGVETYSSRDAARTALAGEDLVFVIGGGQVYAQYLEEAHLLYLTIINREYDGDAFFPPYEHLIDVTFRLMDREQYEGFEFTDYVRIEAAR